MLSSALVAKAEGTLKCIPTFATDNCEELPKLDIIGLVCIIIGIIFSCLSIRSKQIQ